MPLFYQHNINGEEKLGVWKIEENEEFFLSKVPLNRDISHEHKRLQHLAGRYLLQQLFPDFPYELIQIADTRKPFLFNEAYHFSISHCGDYAAALVSKWHRCGVDIELVTPTIKKIQHKFLNDHEITLLEQETAWAIKGANDFNQEISTHLLVATEINAAGSLMPQVQEMPLNNNGNIAECLKQIPPSSENLHLLTLCWSAKEAIYKWFGNGMVDFKKHMQITRLPSVPIHGWMHSDFIFQKEKPVPLQLRSRFFGNVVLTYVIS